MPAQFDLGQRQCLADVVMQFGCNAAALPFLCQGNF